MKKGATYRKIKNSLGQVFDSQMDAKRKTGISQSSISLALAYKIESAGKDDNGDKIYWEYL